LVDENGNPLNDVKIEVIDKEMDKVVASPMVNTDGYSRISLPSGKKYDIVVTKSGFLYKTINVDLPDSVGYEKKLEDVKLEKVEVGKKVVLNNITFDINQSKLRKESYSDLNNAVDLMKANPSIEIEISGHSDNLGAAKNNLQLSKQRAKSVMDYLISKGCDKKRLTYKGYGSIQPVASNDTKEGRQQNRRTEFKVLKVGSDYITVPGANSSKIPATGGNENELKDNTSEKLEIGKKIVLDHISFDLNQSTLQKEYLSEFDNTIELMNDIPSLEIEISGHTDNRGGVENNQKLSTQRAKSVMDYFISRGIDKNRMQFTGYGPGQPIADNETKEGRKTNRRIELKVLKVAPGYTIKSGKNAPNIADPDKTIPPAENVKPATKKSKKKYHSKGNRGKNRVNIGGKKG
jgi:outer membrane protein OmpA-like peptidoglycan-associated protein